MIQKSHKQIVVYLCHGILVGNKHEQNSITLQLVY